jgi:hypothetical protein
MGQELTVNYRPLCTRVMAIRRRHSGILIMTLAYVASVQSDILRSAVPTPRTSQPGQSTEKVMLNHRRSPAPSKDVLESNLYKNKLEKRYLNNLAMKMLPTLRPNLGGKSLSEKSKSHNYKTPPPTYRWKQPATSRPWPKIYQPRSKSYRKPESDEDSDSDDEWSNSKQNVHLYDICIIKTMRCFFHVYSFLKHWHQIMVFGLCEKSELRVVTYASERC